jgi:hypothetical protein
LTQLVESLAWRWYKTKTMLPLATIKFPLVSL